MYRLDLLGPVVLQAQGRAVPLATQKVTALLVLLALAGAQPRARIAAWLWPALDEPSARRNLRRELARLREAGAGPLLRADGEVLALATPPLLDCDAWALAAAAQPDEPAEPAVATRAGPAAADALLALWRGPAADGLLLDGAPDFQAWLEVERARLQGLRRRLLLAAAAAHEAQGRPDHAAAQLQRLLDDDPLQEQLHRELMRLHLAAGRREAALAQYAQCRDVLQRELGLAPMAATEALAAQAQAATPAVASPSPLPLPSPPASARAAASPHADAAVPAAAPLPLAGREAAWAALQQAWTARRPVLIEGEAGAGKTRLAGDFAAAQGAYALAQCRAGDADTPYAAVKRALRVLAGPSIAAAGLPGWVVAELAHLLPELGPASARTPTAEDRSRLHEAVAAAWQQLAAGNFDSVVIDDWHLADRDSRGLLALIARTSAPGPGADTPRLIFTLRPELPDGARAAVHDLVAEGALHLGLDPLDAGQLHALVQAAFGAAPAPRVTRRLLQATGGNPFFVGETLRHWQALSLLARRDDGRWDAPGDDAGLPVPASVRDAVLARVQRQGAATRRLLEAAALATEPFTPALLAGACALGELEALDAIDQALAAGLLRELGGGYALAHDLVQSAIETALPPERRRLAHRRLALGAEAAGLAPAEIARHWEAGGELRRAVPHRLAAAGTALALASWDTAELHWQAARADDPEPAQLVALLRQRWPTLQVRDDRPALQAVVDELESLHLHWAGHPDSARAALEARVEQALVLSLGLGLHSRFGVLDLADAVLPALTDDDPLRVRAQLARAQGLNNAGRHAQAEQAVEDALSRPGPGLTPKLQAQLLHTLAYSHYSRGQPQRALPYAERTLLVWQAAGDRRMTVRSLANIGLMNSAIGDQARAVQALEEARQRAAELRLVDVQREVCNNLADIMLTFGDPGRALTLADEALGLSAEWVRPAFQVFLGGMKVQALWQQGRLGAALDTAGQTLALALQQVQASGRTDVLADAVSMSLDVFTFVGDHAGADRWLAHLAAQPRAVSPHFAVKLGFNRARLALDRGDIEAARQALPAAADVAALQEQRDQEHAVLCHAEGALAEGDAAEALRWLRDWPAPQAHVEVAARRALVALKAAARQPTEGGAAEPLAEAVAAAHTAAADPRCPRPTAAELLQALAACGAAPRDGFDAARDALASSLATHPLQRAALLARWR